MAEPKSTRHPAPLLKLCVLEGCIRPAVKGRRCQEHEAQLRRNLALLAKQNRGH